MSQQLGLVYFPNVNLGDIVNSIGDGIYPQGTIVDNLPGINPQFFLAKGLDGENILCTVKTTDGPLVGVFSNNHVIAIIAPPTVVVDFVGGRPDDRR